MSRKSSDDGGGGRGGGVGGWHYIFPIYDCALHSTTWTPRTDSVAKWPRHDATLEGGGFFESGGPLMERGSLLIFFHSWPILSTRFQWTKPGIQWSLVEKWNSRPLGLPEVYSYDETGSVQETLHNGIARRPSLLFTFESFGYNQNITASLRALWCFTYVKILMNVQVQIGIWS